MDSYQFLTLTLASKYPECRYMANNFISVVIYQLRFDLAFLLSYYWSFFSMSIKIVSFKFSILIVRFHENRYSYNRAFSYFQGILLSYFTVNYKKIMNKLINPRTYSKRTHIICI